MEKELERLKEILHSTNPISDDYTKILDRIEKIYRLENMGRNTSRSRIAVLSADYSALATEPVENYERPAKVLDNEAAIEKPEPVEDAEKAPAEETPKAPTKGATKEDMRAAINKLTAHGILVKPFISKYVPEGAETKFSLIPKDRYPEAIAEIEKLIAEKEQENAE